MNGSRPKARICLVLLGVLGLCGAGLFAMDDAEDPERKTVKDLAGYEVLGLKQKHLEAHRQRTAAEVITVQYSPSVMDLENVLPAVLGSSRVTQCLDEKGFAVSRTPSATPRGLPVGNTSLSALQIQTFYVSALKPYASIDSRILPRQQFSPHFAQQTVLLLLTLRGKEDVEAGPLLKTVIERLQADLAETQKQRLAAVQERTGVLGKQMQEAQKRYAALLTNLVKPDHVPIEALQQSSTMLQARLLDLEITKAGKEARQKAVTETIAKLAKVEKPDPAEDPYVKAFEAQLKLLKEELASTRARVNVGRAQPAEVLRIEVQILSHKAGLANRIKEVQKANMSGQLQDLNPELEDLSTDLAEIEATILAAKKLLKEVNHKLLVHQLNRPFKEEALLAPVENELKELRRSHAKLEAIVRGATQLKVLTPDMKPAEEKKD